MNDEFASRFGCELGPDCLFPWWWLGDEAQEAILKTQINIDIYVKVRLYYGLEDRGFLR